MNNNLDVVIRRFFIRHPEKRLPKKEERQPNVFDGLITIISTHNIEKVL